MLRDAWDWSETLGRFVATAGGDTRAPGHHALAVAQEVPPAGIAAVLGGSISCFHGPAIEASSGSLWTRVAFKRSAAATTNESAKETLCATLTAAALAQSALVRVLPGGGQALQVGDSFSRGFFTKIVERDVLLIRQCDSACL